MASEDIEEFLAIFNALTKKRTKFLSVQNNISEDIKQLTKSIYNFTKLEEGGSKISSAALQELIVDKFDEEQIWQQIELQNCAQWDSLTLRVSNYLVHHSKLNFPVQLLPSANTKDTSEDKIPSIAHLLKHKEDTPIEKFFKKDDTVQKTKKQGKTSIVDDEFFKLREMETFLDQEDKKEILALKQKTKNAGSDEDSIDLFEENEGEDSDEENEDIYNMKYHDFFGTCEQNYGKKYENHSDSENEDVIKDEVEDHESEDDKKNSKKGFRLKIDNSVSDDGSGDDTDQTAKTTNNILACQQSIQETTLTQHEVRQQRLREKIHKLEQKNLSEKTWQLKGEVDASTRPQNSLLEEVVDFDLTTRPAPIITEETTLKLEDIIKQRIKDKVWDDVKRKIKPVPETNVFRKAIILDQEKSKISLAQVYELEYVKQKRSANCDEDIAEEEPEQHKKIKRAMLSLFAKLDALSNYHYTPKPAHAEVKIVSNIHAISMEEVAPVATSDAALLAPEEVKGKRKGDLISKSERTATDKKRERRKKKNLQREKQKEKNKKERLLTKLSLDLGNKYSKEKASKMFDKDLKDSYNTNRMIEVNNVRALKSSKAFFSQLNDDVPSSVKSEKNKKELMPAKKYKL